MDIARVTVTLSAKLVAGIDQLEPNRSRFVSEAVTRELARRRREALLVSLRNPHPQTAEFEALGFGDWAESLPEADEDLIDMKAFKPVHWVEGKGWIKGPSEV